MTDNSTGLKMWISLILELTRQHGNGDHLKGPCVHNGQYDQNKFRKKCFDLDLKLSKFPPIQSHYHIHTGLF